MSADPGAAAAKAWDDYLRTAPDLAGEVRAFEDAVTDRGLVYGDRSAFTVYRPRFIAAGELERLRRETGLVARALAKAEEAILDDPDRLLPSLGEFSDAERAFLSIPRRLSRGDLQVRLDAARVADGYRFFELNGGIPGGIEFVHTAQEVFRATPAFRALAERFPLSGFDLRGRMVRSVLAAWREFGGAGAPRVAIVDWLDEAGLIEEFHTAASWLADAGLDVALADAGALQYADGRLSADGREIDVVYRRLTTFDMIERAEDVAPLVDAARDGAACLIDPLPQSTLDRKALFAFVTDPALDVGLTGEERAACRRSVPWTRLLGDRRTTDPTGADVDLIEHARRRREDLILKPNHDYGGRGLHIGWETSGADWDTALEEALEGEWVVQAGARAADVAEYPPCGAPEERVAFHESTDPYLFAGDFGGILTRLSTTTATNVTAGGSATPTFVVDG